MSNCLGFFFNLRTRGLNNFCFQIVQFIGPAILIFILDAKFIPNRKIRGILGVCGTGVVAISASVGMYILLEVVDYPSFLTTPAADWSYSFLWRLHGDLSHVWLTYSSYALTVEWVFSCLSNDPAVLAEYAGFVRGLGSLEMMISFLLAAEKIPTWVQVTVQLM